MAYVDLANRVYNGPSYMDLGAPSGVVWDARLDLLPLSTTANASELRAALTAMGLTLTRASSATVQTSASEVVTSGIGVDDPRVGRYGLVIEEARTSQVLRAAELTTAPWVKQLGTETWTANAAASPDGATTAESVVTAASAAGGIAQTWASYAAATYTVSTWAQAQSGSQSFNFRVPNVIGASNQVLAAQTCNTSWARKSSTAVVTGATGGGSTVIMNVGAAAYALNLWGAQLEAGAFATELILTTGAAATRAADRLAMSDASRIIRNGRLSMARRFVPKGSIGGSNDYAAAVRLWTVDASNYAELHQTTGVCTVVVAGASYSTASGFTWAANDVVDVWCEAGGGALSTVVKARKNSGAVTTLGTGAAQGTIPSNAGIDLASNGTSSVLTASHQQIQAFAPGRRVAWAA